MNTMAHLPHPAGQDLLGEWTSSVYSPHSRGGGGRLIHSLCKMHPSMSTGMLGKWGSKTVPVGNTETNHIPPDSPRGLSNVLQETLPLSCWML